MHRSAQYSLWISLELALLLVGCGAAQNTPSIPEVCEGVASSGAALSVVDAASLADPYRESLVVVGFVLEGRGPCPPCPPESNCDPCEGAYIRIGDRPGTFDQPTLRLEGYWKVTGGDRYVFEASTGVIIGCEPASL